jgi:ABC-type amino acid transport substrate-binding protein
MTQRFCTIFSFLICLLLLSGCKEDKNSAKETKNTVITVVTSADYPPFEYYINSEMVGFEIDLMKAIAKELKRDVVFQDVPFESIIGSLQSARADLAISGLSATEDRKKFVDFSAHYNESKTVILTDDSSIKTTHDLKGKMIGVQMGTTYETNLKEWQQKVENLQIQSLSKVPDLIQNFKAKRIVGIMLGIGEAKAILEQIKELRIVDVPDTDVFYAIAFPKGSPLLASVNAAIEKLKANGTMKVLQDKWLKGSVDAA